MLMRPEYVCIISDPQKGIQFKFYILDQNVGISPECILTNFEVFALSRFQHVAVQN